MIDKSLIPVLVRLSHIESLITNRPANAPVESAPQPKPDPKPEKQPEKKQPVTTANNSMKKPTRTLGAARNEIAGLRSQLGLPSLAYSQQAKSLSTAAADIETLRKQLVNKPTAAKAAAEVKKLVTSSLVTLESLENLQTQLNGVDSIAGRIGILEKASAAYRSALRASKDGVEQVQLLRSIQRLEKCRAYEIRQDPALWAKRNYQQQEL